MTDSDLRDRDTMKTDAGSVTIVSALCCEIHARQLSLIYLPKIISTYTWRRLTQDKLILNRA
jgi:uncharacterized circularly permuted ATP-grasp superfamily protein